MPQLIIKPGRERSLHHHHPWIFSGAISALHGTPSSGEIVEVISNQGEFLARAAYNPTSNIAGRVWTWNPNEEVTSELIEDRIERAINVRRQLGKLISSDAMRLVHGESDGIPGLILDQYGDMCVIQFLTAGVEYWRNSIIEIIMESIHPNVIYERSDVDVRELEGLKPKKGLLFGRMSNNLITINENGLKIWVDIVEGHKTGYYLDQRENRLLARILAGGRKVLDCFSYTGGFSLNSISGQAASVSMVDSSYSALNTARENLILNNFNLDNVLFNEQDVFKYLRTLRDKSESFDLIILDPPKFAPTISQAERAARGYKDINLLAFKLLNPGGYLMSFSCSGGVNEDLFQKIVAGAALEAGVEAKILGRLHQAIDHPVALNFPEGAYLKGFLIQKQN
jgi:23S rRNA (cytosine1962-C5)-methyltransferase